MDFFNSLSEVIKNKNNFKKWEKKQKDEQAQREALYQRRKYTPEEIAKAKAMGENIIEVIDVMDNHSESVAENVETATEPIIAIVPLAAFFLSSYGIGKYILPPEYDKINRIETKIFKENNADELVEKIREHFVRTTNNKRLQGFYTGDLTSEYRINKIKDSELKSKALDIINKIKNETASPRRTIKAGIFGVIGATIVSFMGSILYTTKLQVDSSKIARFQARKALEDPKEFVTYTPEQIAKAKVEIAKHPELLKEKQEEKLKTGFFVSIKNLFRDRREYKNARKNDSDDSKKVSRPLSKEEIQQAKRDQEVIQRSVRIINNEAEKYSQNMEVAANVIMNGTPLLGMAIGGLTAFIMEKMGIIEKYVENKINQNGSEETKELYKQFKNLEKERKTGLMFHSANWSKFSASYMDDITNKVKNNKGKKLGFLGKLKSWGVTALAHRWGAKGIIGYTGSMLASIAGAMISLKLQKSSARAGRYTAKRELEKDPRNFIGYTDEDFNEVKDVKNTKKESSKIKEYAMFIPNVLKQYWAYSKYKDGEYKQKQVLREQLKKQPVTKEQLREAKNLQRKLFNTFEKVDDNSQTYSESMEAAIDIAQPFVMYGGMATLLAPFIYIGVQMKRGKITPASVMNKISKWMSKSSEKMKTDWFKKYLGNVAKNVTRKAENTYVAHKPVATILQGIDLKNATIFEIMEKSWKNFRASTEDLRNMKPHEQEKILNNYRSKLKTAAFLSGKSEFGQKIDNIFGRLLDYDMTPQTRADVLDIILNPSKVKSMTQGQFNKAKEVLGYISKNAVGTENVDRANEIIKNSLNNIPIEKIKEFAAEIKSAKELQQYIPASKIDELVRLIENIKSKNGTDIINDVVTQNNINKVAEIIETIETKFSEFKQKIKNNDKLKTLYEGLKNKSEMDVELIEVNGEWVEKPKENIFTAIEQIKKVINECKNLKPKNLLDMMPEKFQKLRDPHVSINAMIEEFEKMSETEFLDFSGNIPIRGLEKQNTIEMLRNLDKVIDNIPKDEVNKIWDTIIDEFQKHPDEVIKMVTNGSISSIFITPTIQNAMIGAGVSWVALTLVTTYAIEAWLADIQLKAGRLGVMNAINSLKDIRYYADIEPNVNNA